MSSKMMTTLMRLMMMIPFRNGGGGFALHGPNSQEKRGPAMDI
jgi:hypothetical protein